MELYSISMGRWDRSHVLTIVIILSWESGESEPSSRREIVGISPPGTRRIFAGRLGSADQPYQNKYFVILRGEINGYEAGFFDLFIGAGKNWFINPR